MLKTTKSPYLSRPEVGNGNGEVVGFSNGDSEELVKKSGKLKAHNLYKSRKSVKSGKNLSKSENSLKFGATITGLSFLTPGAWETFNHLRVVFIKATIL